MYPDREVFQKPPLALVVAEVRFTDAARLRRQQTKDELAIAVEGRFPYAEPLQQTDLSLTPGVPPQLQQRNGVVLKNAISTESLTVMAESLTYETTAYTNFQDLLDAITIACDALVASGVRPAVRRVGLRYIDEVRVPNHVSDVRDWERWIDRRLLQTLYVGPEGAPATTMQGVSTFDLGDGKGFDFRFAALNQGPVVVPHHLRRPAVEPEPFFVLDFDGFHVFTDSPATPLDSEVVGESLSAVHVPCGTAFQRAITDDARRLFRGNNS